MTATLKRLLVSLLLSAAVFAFFSWPLPRRLGADVAYTSARAEPDPVRTMVPGDHLQIVFHFWVASDWLRGGTPFGRNPYIFNVDGGDGERSPMLDYAPHTLVYAAGERIGGRAFGWNLALFVSLWLTHFFTARWLRFHGASERVAPLAALVAITLPYRWATAFGGSPTGVGMMSVPMLLYGLEAVLRDGSWRGGVAAGLAILFALWTDTHVLLFSLLLGPFWAAWWLLDNPKFPWRRWHDWRRRLLASLPALAAVGAALYQSLKEKSGLQETTMAAGRSFREIALFSPRAHGLFEWRADGHEHTIYIGMFLAALAAAGWILLAVRAARARRWRALGALVLLAAGVAAMLAFALGPYGPRDGLALRLARKAVSAIEMIRQPAKVFCVLPPLLALLAVPALQALSERRRHPWLNQLLPALLVLPVVLDHGLQIRPGLCTLDTRQPAYAAVAADAKAAGKPAHALVLPVWPGDSAWASLYEHHASLYRIRLVNGYLPKVSKTYVDTVFKPLENANAGVFGEPQIRFLREHGIDYVLLHEDAFPEKVSWFPVGFTLRHLLRRADLPLLARHENVWAFKLAAAGGGAADRKPSAADGWTLFGSSLQSEMERERLEGGAAIAEDDSASAGRFVRLAAAGDSTGLDPFDHLDADDPRLLVRVRGAARWTAVTESGGGAVTNVFDTRAGAWTWEDLPLRKTPGGPSFRPTFTLVEGALDIDRVCLVDGAWPRPAPGETIRIPAAALYHAGYTDPAKNEVVLRPSHEPADRIVYGPRWPLPPGRYRVEAVMKSEAPAAMEVGHLVVAIGNWRSERQPVSGGGSEPVVFSTRGNDLPVEIGFHFNRSATVRLSGFLLTRID